MVGESPKHLIGRQRTISLMVWAFFALAFLAVYAADLRLSYSLIDSPCAGVDCHYQAITGAEAAVLADMGLSVAAYAIYMLGSTVFAVLIYLILALLILARLSSRRFGLLLALQLIVLPTTSITSFDVVAKAYPAWSAAIIGLMGLGSLLMMLFFLTFPNGRLAPRWSILIPLIFSFATISDVLANLRRSVPVGPLAILMVTSSLLAVIIVVVYRYRRLFNHAERQQAKWVFFGILIYMLGVPVWGYTFEFGAPPPGQARLATTLIGWALTQLLSVVLPVTIVIGILRYRLWDIDLIVRRTLVYGSVTALLAGIYFGTVVLLQNLVTVVTGQSSPVVIVVSTLIIAGLFNPLRQGVQQIIDRRFYRQKYDAARTLDSFTQTARDEVDIDELSLAIVDLVRSTMRPAHVSLWLNKESHEEGP